MNKHQSRTTIWFEAVVIVLSCMVATTIVAEDRIEVLSADPPGSERNVHSLDVTINGSGFVPDSQVEFYVTGTCNKGGIQVNWVRYEGDDRLIVNVDVAADAATSAFDVYVRAGGRTGKGTELFIVKMSVNSSTDGFQGFSDVAMNAAGDFVVVWASDCLCGLFAQRFDASGAREGSEFNVNSSTGADTVAFPSVAMNAAGAFAVTWVGWSFEEEEYQLFVRLFDSAGEPVAGEFQVDPQARHVGLFSDVAMDDFGNVVVVWTDEDVTVSTRRGIFGRRFDRSGRPLGSEIQINTRELWGDEGCSFSHRPGASLNIWSAACTWKPSVAMSATGEFTTVWNDVWAPSCGATGEFVFGQTIDSTTRPLGGEFQIEVQRCPEISVGPSQAVWLRSDVAIDDAGNTVVIWNGGRIVGQFLDGSGAPVGAEFPISDVATTPVHEPSVATAGGDFLAVWIREDSPGSPLRVHGRRFDSDGVLLGDELVAPSAEGEQWTPAVAMNDRGDAVITWSGGKEFFKSDVFASLNKPGCPPSPVGPIFYVDQVRYGESLTLAVDGAGEGRELYQWYQDEEPVQSATSPRFTTEPLSRTTTFRVEVTSVCGTTTSETVTVSVGERRRGIRR